MKVRIKRLLLPAKGELSRGALEQALAAELSVKLEGVSEGARLEPTHVAEVIAQHVHDRLGGTHP